MKPTSKFAAGCAGAVVALLATLLSVPFLAVASDGTPSEACVGVADDGTPSILGPGTLTADDLRTWWQASRGVQPPRLGAPIDDVIALYLTEGGAEGVRGDWAFAQAILETGYFTNTDTAINNFAGIAHYDHATSGMAFPDVTTGVRAHVQLLRKYALGNDTEMARPDVSPNAGATSTTWGGLAGTWATSPEYWPSLSALYESIATHTGRAELLDGQAAAEGCAAGLLAVSGEYALPVERSWYDRHPEWFTKPHHDYPSADLPVPTGTPLYATHAGVVVAITTSGRCGIGVIINGDDGAQYIYCHGLPGSHAVTISEHTATGQLLMLSASTGNSTGPHLHFGIRINGQNLCPQPLFLAIVDNEPIEVSDLPASGCTY